MLLENDRVFRLSALLFFNGADHVDCPMISGFPVSISVHFATTSRHNPCQSKHPTKADCIFSDKFSLGFVGIGCLSEILLSGAAR